MTPEQNASFVSRCWRVVERWLPAFVRPGFKKVMGVILRPFRPRPPSDIHPDDLQCQLDAILREMRRLHVRLEELQEATRQPRNALARPARGEDQQAA
jgi:hypothetical protein